MPKTSKFTGGSLASAGSLLVLLQLATGCAWKSDMEAAQVKVAEQAATLDQVQLELQSLRQEHDRLGETNRELEASLTRLRAEYDGCLPKSERSGSTDSSGRFTARYRRAGDRHEWAIYDGVAFNRTFECTVGDCSTGAYKFGYPADASAEELEAVAREWKRIAAGKR